MGFNSGFKGLILSLSRRWSVNIALSKCVCVSHSYDVCSLLHLSLIIGLMHKPRSQCLVEPSTRIRLPHWRHSLSQCGLFWKMILRRNRFLTKTS